MLLKTVSMNNRFRNNRNLSVLQEAMEFVFYLLWYQRCSLAREKELHVNTDGSVSMLQGRSVLI